jgi:alanine racemase
MSQRNTWLEVDLGAIASNVRVVRRRVERGAKIFVALKANAYGFGLLPVARAVKAAGADALGVGSVDDGVRVRESGIHGPVLVYGGDLLSQATVYEMERHELTATIHDVASLRACRRWVRGSLEVMVEVDVGLGRLGFDRDEVARVVQLVRDSRRLRLNGVYTHMRVRAGEDLSALRRQFATFEAAVALAGPVPIAMAASSAVLDVAPEMALGAVDVGRAVYGLLPRKDGVLGPHLRPAFARLRSRLVAVKELSGRQRSPELKSVRRLGVIPYGRASGLANLAATSVLVGGRRARLVAQPSLEHMRVDLGRHPSARVGDEVVIIGRQRLSEISLDEALREHPGVPDLAAALQVAESIPRLYRSGHRLTRASGDLEI